MLSCLCFKGKAACMLCVSSPWATRYNTWLVNLTPKGAVSSFLFFASSHLVHVLQVDLVQAGNLSWFGYPDDTIPSARTFLPGLNKVIPTAVPHGRPALSSTCLHALGSIAHTPKQHPSHPSVACHTRTSGCCLALAVGQQECTDTVAMAASLQKPCQGHNQPGCYMPPPLALHPLDASMSAQNHHCLSVSLQMPTAWSHAPLPEESTHPYTACQIPV